MKIRNQEQAVLEFKNAVLNIFKRSRIISLVYFGTRAFNINNNDESDYDFMLILDKYNASDSWKIRSLVNKDELKSLDLNLNFLYLDDISIRGSKNFQLRSVLLSLYEYLACAKILVGENIFIKDPLALSSSEIVDEFKFKIQEYYGRCDKLFAQKMSERDLYLRLTKYIRDITRFFFIMKGGMTIKDMANYSYSDMFDMALTKEIFSPTLLKKLPVLLEPYLGKESVLGVERVRRLVYEEYLSTYFSPKLLDCCKIV